VSQRNAPPISPSEANKLAVGDDLGETPATGAPQADDENDPITTMGPLPDYPGAPVRPAPAQDPPRPAAARNARSFGRISTPTEMSMPVPPVRPASGYAPPSPSTHSRTAYNSGPVPRDVPRDVADDSGSVSRPAFVAQPQTHVHPSHPPSASRPLPPPPPAPPQHSAGYPGDTPKTPGYLDAPKSAGYLETPRPSGASAYSSPAPSSFPAAGVFANPGTPPPPHTGRGAMAIRADVAQGLRAAASNIIRSHSYSFVLDERGIPVEIGSGRSAKAFLGEERWVESKTDFRRDVVIKILQKGVSEEDHMRFQMEKELLERVQGHPNIVRLYGSGESEDPSFIPPAIRDKVQSEFVIIERLEMSLEERLKGPRERGKREDLLTYEMRERIFRVLDYMIPIASAVEFAHLVRNVCHRDLKPANVLIGLPDPNLVGSVLEVRLADFNIAKLHDEEFNVAMTRTNMNPVPGTLFFQSPEQETNVIELLVNVVQGSAEVEFFEDFYIQIEKNDTFALFNRGEHYPILRADRGRKKIILGRPYREASESNVRAKVQKSVGRPADIYSIGAMLYYLISGAYGNPKTIYDNFHKFIEYERADGSNTIEAYLQHEYAAIEALRAPKSERAIDMAPADKFFSYKHYLDGNGDLIDAHVMRIIAKCMIRNKPDSYCQAHEIETRGISEVVKDLIDIYTILGTHPAARPANLRRVERARPSFGKRLRRAWHRFWSIFRRR
jgi:serine/threonine protein kinase